MNDDSKWEARAHAIYNEEWGICSGANPETVRSMLQLAREMADEARQDQQASDAARAEVAMRQAADARAEEIAQELDLCELGACGQVPAAYRNAARLARSTITKSKEPLTWTMDEAMREPVKAEAAIRADEREKIASMFERYGFASTAEKIRALDKPKTREAVLEAALDKIAEGQACTLEHACDIAKLALRRYIERPT